VAVNADVSSAASEAKARRSLRRDRLRLYGQQSREIANLLQGHCVQGLYRIIELLGKRDNVCKCCGTDAHFYQAYYSIIMMIPELLLH